MTVTNITICNRSLVRLGTSTISDFTSNDKSVICGTIYPTFSTGLLAIYNWRFAAKKVLLVATTVPTNAWSYAYSLPADFIKLRNVYNSSSANAKPLIAGYERFGNVIMTNETTLYADYTYNIAESLWPDWYAEFVSNAFCSEIAIPIAEDSEKESFYRQKSFGTPDQDGEGGMYKVCKRIDSSQQPVPTLPTPSLISARFS